MGMYCTSYPIKVVLILSQRNMYSTLYPNPDLLEIQDERVWTGRVVLVQRANSAREHRTTDLLGYIRVGGYLT